MCRIKRGRRMEAWERGAEFRAQSAKGWCRLRRNFGRPSCAGRALPIVLYFVYASISIPLIFSFSDGFHWGTSFLFLAAHTLKGTGEKKRSNTLKGTGEKKAPPRRVGLSNMNDRLLAAEIFVYKARFTSMGRPRCGLPPIRATRFAQTGAAANAIIHIALPSGTGQLQMGGELYRVVKLVRRRAVAGAVISFILRRALPGAFF